MDVGWVQLMELCLEKMMVMRIASSLVCLSAERTGMLKVMQLECSMVMSLVSSLAGSMAMRKGLMMAHLRP